MSCMSLGSGGPHRKKCDFLRWVILSTEGTKIIENHEHRYAWIGQGSQNDTFKYFILFYFFEHDFSIGFD